MSDCAEGMGKQTVVRARSRNRRRVWVRCTGLECSVLCKVLVCRDLWERGAGIRLRKSWVSARDVRMCVVCEGDLRVEGVVGRRGAGTGSGRKIHTDQVFAKAPAWFLGWEREVSRDYPEICW